LGWDIGQDRPDASIQAGPIALEDQASDLGRFPVLARSPVSIAEKSVGLLGQGQVEASGRRIALEIVPEMSNGGIQPVKNLVDRSPIELQLGRRQVVHRLDGIAELEILMAFVELVEAGIRTAVLIFVAA